MGIFSICVINRVHYNQQGEGYNEPEKPRSKIIGYNELLM